MRDKIFRVLICATDGEGEFFQNLYPYATDKSLAEHIITDFLEKSKYRNISVEEIEHFNDDLTTIEHLIESKDFEGYIQNTKFTY